MCIIRSDYIDNSTRHADIINYRYALTLTSTGHSLIYLYLRICIYESGPFEALSFYRTETSQVLLLERYFVGYKLLEYGFTLLLQLTVIRSWNSVSILLI